MQTRFDLTQWVEGRLHELWHGQEEKFLAQLAQLKVPRGPSGETVRFHTDLKVL